MEIRSIIRRVVQQSDASDMPGKPHPLSAPGRFYVDADCCITCGVPLVVAPDLFAWAPDVDGHIGPCYVKRQPVAAEELERMHLAMESQEAGCIYDREVEEGE